MGHLRDHRARQRLRIAVHLFDRVKRARRHACGLETRQPVIGGMSPEYPVEFVGETLPVFKPRRIVDETGVLGQFGRLDGLDDTKPIRLVRRSERDMAVGGLKRLIRRVERMGRAHGAGRSAARKGNRRLPIAHGDARLE